MQDPIFSIPYSNAFSFQPQRGDQLIAKSTVAVLALVWSTAAVFLLLTALHVNKYTPWLTFLYFFSYVKLGVTLTKYIPQVSVPPTKWWYLALKNVY